MAALTEPEVLDGQRAMREAQNLLAGPVTSIVDRAMPIGWYGTTVDGREGCFAVVQTGAGLDELLGEVVLVTVGERQVYAYVLGARAVPTRIALARRAYLAVGLLAAETLTARIELTT